MPCPGTPGSRRFKRDVDGIFGVDTIELLLQTSDDQFAGHANVVHFLALLAERFARQRVKALAKVEGKADDGLAIVLFLGTHNAGRSQMALGWYNHLAGDHATAWSGAPNPAPSTPTAAVATREIGIDSGVDQ